MFNHDQAFKNLIIEYMHSALRFLFPELTATWPENVVIKPVRQEQLKEYMGDNFRELDTPLEVQFPDGSREALIVVIETESRDRKDFLKYLAVVSIHISMLMKTDRVVPAVLYPFRKRPFAGRFTLNDGIRNYLDFSCVSCVLSKIDALKYEHSRNIVARLCLPLMGHQPTDKLRLITKAYEGLIELEPDFGKQVKFSEFINHYAKLEMTERKELQETYIKRSPFRENVMTLAKIWDEEGRAKGRAEGNVELIVSMYEAKEISATVARARLKLIAGKDAVAKALVVKAMTRITK